MYLSGSYLKRKERLRSGWFSLTRKPSALENLLSKFGELSSFEGFRVTLT